jgi:hypothetical protein
LSVASNDLRGRLKSDDSVSSTLAPGRFILRRPPGSDN